MINKKKPICEVPATQTGETDTASFSGKECSETTPRNSTFQGKTSNDAMPEARRDLLPPLVHTYDAIDHEVAGNPIHDRIPRQRSTRGADRVLALLDDIQVESLRERAYEEGGAH